MKLHVTSDLASVAGPLLARALRDGGRLALSGGSTPAPVLRWLRAHLPAEVYPRLSVTWVDERHVPRDHPDSNAGLAWREWLQHVQPAEVIELTSTGSLDEGRARVEAALEHIDVALLGAGPDGHIASLFPGHPALEEEGRVLAIRDSPKPPPHRLTLSLGMLQRVRCAVLLARGAGKAGMLARAAGGDRSLPLGRYRPEGDYHWVLDPDAARELT